MKYEFLTKNFTAIVKKFKKVGFTKEYANIGENEIYLIHKKDFTLRLRIAKYPTIVYAETFRVGIKR